LVIDTRVKWEDFSGYGPFSSNDGRRIAMELPEGTVHVWDAESGKRLLRIVVGKSCDIEFSRDGHWLGVAEKDKTIRLWKID
jgi:WD40 repeat protein